MVKIYNMKEQLPTEEKCYLVFGGGSKNSLWTIAEYYADIKGFYDDNGTFLDNVTHWTELPEYPRKEV